MLNTLPMITLVPAACAIPQIIERLELFKPIEVNYPLLLETDEEFEEFSEGESLPTELAVDGVEGVEAVSTKTYPCIINVNNALYDYTPLRVAATSLTGGWVNATDVAPPASTKIWIFAWC